MHEQFRYVLHIIHRDAYTELTDSNTIWLQRAATPCRTVVQWPSLWRQYTTSAVITDWYHSSFQVSQKTWGAMHARTVDTWYSSLIFPALGNQAMGDIILCIKDSLALVVTLQQQIDPYICMCTPFHQIKPLQQYQVSVSFNQDSSQPLWTVWNGQARVCPVCSCSAPENHLRSALSLCSQFHPLPGWSRNFYSPFSEMILCGYTCKSTTGIMSTSLERCRLQSTALACYKEG